MKCQFTMFLNVVALIIYAVYILEGLIDGMTDVLAATCPKMFSKLGPNKYPFYIGKFYL